MEPNLIHIYPPYGDLSIIYDQCLDETNFVCLYDHLGGFGPDKRNRILDYLNDRAKSDNRVINLFLDYDPRQFASNYKNLEMGYALYSGRANSEKLLNKFIDYKEHPVLDFKNFVCSFNGHPHMSRWLLTSLLKKFNWFSPAYCTQNFVLEPDKIDGCIQSLVPNEDRFYRKFFVHTDILEEHSINYERFDHLTNVKTLETPLTQSFLHLVSETMATSYCPIMTEKFYYSIVTRGLFLAFAPPNWHKTIEDVCGFKLYSRLFDYGFDKIENPVKRLIEMTSMISKFSHLSMNDLHDLYLMELDTINYNYDHFMGGAIWTHIEQVSSTHYPDYGTITARKNFLERKYSKI